jgi:hypothetical protein
MLVQADNQEYDRKGLIYIMLPTHFQCLGLCACSLNFVRLPMFEVTH